MTEIRQPIPLLKKLLPRQKPQTDTLYVPSQFALAFDLNDKHYVYHTLTKQCVEAELPRQCHADEAYDDLIESYFLVPEGKDEAAFYQSISQMMRIYSRKEGERGYIILPTLRCNARCVYCYEEGAMPTTMSSETVEQTIRYIIDSHADDKVALTWFGGEPLLCVNIIDRICEGLREANVPYSGTIVSNGSLVTPQIAEKMAGDWHIKSIQISMDGAKRDYIARKNYFTNDNQYDAVIKAMELIAEKGIRVTVRCNMDEDNFDGLPELLGDMKTLIRHKENVTVYLSPLFEVRASKNVMPFWDKILAARPLIEQAGFHAVNTIGISNAFRIHFCMADAGGVVICPDGTLSPCEHMQEKAAFGDIHNGVTDEAARKEFCRTDRIREKCRHCPFLPDCTAFASCPIYDPYCRELHTKMTLNALKRFILTRKADQDEELQNC